MAWSIELSSDSIGSVLSVQPGVLRLVGRLRYAAWPVRTVPPTPASYHPFLRILTA